MPERAQAPATHEDACDRVASFFSKRWLRHYVASKLRSDPVFPEVYDALRDSAEPIMDVGCGVGLLPFYLRERGLEQPITGFDIDERKVRQAQAIAEERYRGRSLNFFVHDVGDALPQFSGNVALLDVLHYLAPDRQRTLLHELAAMVTPAGLLVLRDCPRDGSLRFRLTRFGEFFAQAISWNIGVPLHFPTREAIVAPFREEEFTREEKPAWGGTPFNNRLFVFSRRSSAAAPAQE